MKECYQIIKTEYTPQSQKQGVVLALDIFYDEAACIERIEEIASKELECLKGQYEGNDSFELDLDGDHIAIIRLWEGREEVEGDRGYLIVSTYDYRTLDYVEAMRKETDRDIMHKYGYQWDGMELVSANEALDIILNDGCVYALNSNDSESLLQNVEELKDASKRGSLFGIEVGIRNR